MTGVGYDKFLEQKGLRGLTTDLTYSGKRPARGKRQPGRLFPSPSHRAGTASPLRWNPRVCRQHEATGPASLPGLILYEFQMKPAAVGRRCCAGLFPGSCSRAAMVVRSGVSEKNSRGRRAGPAGPRSARLVRLPAACNQGGFLVGTQGNVCGVPIDEGGDLFGVCGARGAILTGTDSQLCVGENRI